MVDDEKQQFVVWDWILFGAMLLISIGIGVFYAVAEVLDRKRNTTEEFLMGGRQMQLLPVAISILVSFMSSILILGTPAEMYTAGTLFYVYVIGMILAIFLAAQIFVPLLYPLQLTSSFEYLEKRFNSRAAKLTGTILMIINQIVYMGIVSYAPSTALETVTGFPAWATIITVGFVSTAYTCLGGMKAVVWTCVFQAVIMIAGLLAIVIQGTIHVGGLGEVWRISSNWGRIEFWDANFDPSARHSVWSLVVGGTVAWLSTYGINQSSVQKYCALPTLEKSKIAVLLNIGGVIILLTITSLAGIVMFAYYAQKGCDPLSNGDVSNSNQLIPFFVMEVLGYPGLPGLFISSLFSGALSTMSSCLNASSAVTWEDIINPNLKNEISTSAQTWITRGLVIVYGAAGIGFAFLAQNLGGTVLQATLSLTGAASAPLLGIFLLGGLFPWANWLGCVVGGIVGLIFPLWISIGAYTLPSSGYSLDFPTDNCSNYTPDINSPIAEEISGIQLLYTISYLWYPSIGVTTAVVVGLVVSLVYDLIMGHEITATNIDSKYLIPLFDRIFCCLPKRWRHKLQYNIEFQDPREIQADVDEVDVTITGEKQRKKSLSELFTSPLTYISNGNHIASLSYKQHTAGNGFLCVNDALTPVDTMSSNRYASTEMASRVIGESQEEVPPSHPSRQ